MNREADSTVVHVDGRLAGRSLDALERTITGVGGAVILDLTNLLSADDAGIAALRRLTERGVQTRGVSPYVTLLLRDDR